MNKVIVIGTDHHNTLGVIRSLGERGIRAELILVARSRMTFVDYSKYLSRSIRIESEKNLVALLLETYKDEPEKPVVICCSDASSGAIDDNRDNLSPYFILPGANEQGRISALMSKDKMAELAVASGLNIPQSYYLKDKGEDLSRIQLPCIIKPIESRWGEKSDITICKTIDDLKTFVSSHQVQNYQIQDYIEKDFEYQLIGCATKTDVIIPGESTILRPCKGSNTSFLYYSPIEDGFCELKKCTEFVRRTGYHGLFSLELLRDKKGNDYFMEINFRNDGNAICVTAAGMSLPYIWYLDCIGADYSHESKKIIKPVYVMPDMAELKLLATKQISLREYISDFKKTNRFMEFDKKDMKPFWKLIEYQLCTKLHI